MAVAKDATILDWPAQGGGDWVVLRQGTNNWTCYTDWAASPGNDPECNDPVMEAWFSALMAGEKTPPEITGLGIAYMLMGGSDPSNTDPMAAAPAAGKDWVTSPAHVMMVVPGGFDANQFATDPASGQPFIMWDGTPYEHLKRFSASWFLRRKETGHRLYLWISRTRNPPSCAPVSIVVWLCYVCPLRALMRGYHVALPRGWIERRAPPQFRRQRSGARRVPDSA